MPFTWTIAEDGGAIAEAQGALCAEDFYALNAAIYASDAAIRSLRYQLIDFTHATKIDINGDEVRNVARQDRDAAALNPDMRIALVIGSPAIVFGLARMWAMNVEPATIETRIFRSRAKAEAWLAID